MRWPFALALLTAPVHAQDYAENTPTTIKVDFSFACDDRAVFNRIISEAASPETTALANRELNANVYQGSCSLMKEGEAVTILVTSLKGEIKVRRGNRDMWTAIHFTWSPR